MWYRRKLIEDMAKMEAKMEAYEMKRRPAEDNFKTEQEMIKQVNRLIVLCFILIIIAIVVSVVH